MADSHVLPTASLKRDQCAESLPVTPAADQIEPNPISRIGGFIVQKERLAIAVDYQGIDAAVVVIIPNRQTATENGCRRRNARTCVSESVGGSSQIPKQL